jgi:hypothetical protein
MPLTVGGVCETVGPAMMRLVGCCGDRLVTGTTIYEAAASSDVRAGDLVLGIGVADSAAARQLVAVAEAAQAAGVVLKSPLAHDLSVRFAVPSSPGLQGLCLVEVPGHVAWPDLVWLLRGVVAPGGSPAGQPSLAEHVDLFALADSVALVVMAPITIEDAHSQVLAYSRQGETDAVRLATIMGRQVPEETIARYRSQGVFRKLAQGTEPIFVPALPDGTKSRVVMPITAGGELLGSIWAIVSEPLPSAQAKALAEFASVAAVHLLRVRAAFDLVRRTVAEQLLLLLADGCPEVAEELGLDAGPHRVVIFDVRASGTVADVRRLGLLYSLHNRRGWRRPILAERDGLLYTVFPDGGDKRVSGSWPWLRRVVHDLAPDEPSLLAAAGGVAETPKELPRSKDGALDVVELMRRGLVSGPACCHDDVWAEVTLYRATRGLPRMLAGEPLQSLLDHDAVHGTQYTRTLRAWLEEQCDRGAASRRLHIHPNTFSYRMRRLLQLAPLELEDASVRQALLLQITALRMHSGDEPDLAVG